MHTFIFHVVFTEFEAEIISCIIFLLIKFKMVPLLFLKQDVVHERSSVREQLVIHCCSSSARSCQAVNEFWVKLVVGGGLLQSWSVCTEEPHIRTACCIGSS